ncbi:hypothetical protein [Leptospira idonii]|uniref:hypothetical protein n=1 Tax=Leptospira idonii TaxID=1193500 RepID=UPI001FEBBAFF|nr:hypothetical protein [Leptospira idonii]
MRILFFVTIINILLISSFPLSADAGTKPKSGYYVVMYKNYSVNLDLDVNGYEITNSSSNNDSSGQADINYWILPGKNRLKIKLSPRKGGKESSLGSKTAVRLFIAQAGQFPDEGEQQFSFEWPEAGKEETLSSNLEKTIEFEPPFLPPTSLWEKAKTLEWSSALETSSLTFAETFTKALNTKKVDQIYPFIEFRSKDTSLVRYAPYQEKEEKQSLEGMIQAIGATWKLNKKKVKFTLLCDNKIVSLTDMKGAPILTGKKGAAIPLYLSQIDGTWVIVR